MELELGFEITFPLYSAQRGSVVFAEATMSAESCERGCSERPPIRGIDLPIAEDETGTRRSDPSTEQCDSPIKCKCTQRSF